MYEELHILNSKLRYPETKKSRGKFPRDSMLHFSVPYLVSDSDCFSQLQKYSCFTRIGARFFEIQYDFVFFFVRMCLIRNWWRILRIYRLNVFFFLIVSQFIVKDTISFFWIIKLSLSCGKQILQFTNVKYV